MPVRHEEMQNAKDSTDIPLTLAHEETGSAREAISPAAPLKRNTLLLQSWFALLFLPELSRCRGAARGRLKREDCRASSGWVRTLLGACQNKWTAMSLKTRISPDCQHGSHLSRCDRICRHSTSGHPFRVTFGGESCFNFGRRHRHE